MNIHHYRHELATLATAADAIDSIRATLAADMQRCADVREAKDLAVDSYLLKQAGRLLRRVTQTYEAVERDQRAHTAYAKDQSTFQAKP